MATQSETPTPTRHRLVITRTFDAPRELVVAAWTRPEHLMRWFCPEGFTVLFAQVDARLGGRWRSGMRSPEGEEFIHHGEYRVVDPPRRLVFTHAWEKNHLEPVADTLITIDFDEHDGRTTMTFTHEGFATAESRDSHHEGWSEAFENLAAALAEPESEPAPDADTADREIVITRVLDAPRELVFAAFSDPEHIARWWGPHGFTTTTGAMDFRPGGVWRFVMHGPDGRDYVNRIVYRQIVAPERIVCDHDDGGDVDVEPGCGRKVITFETWGDGGRQTKLTLRMIFPSAAERARIADRYGAVAGGVQTVSRLAEHLAAQAGAPPTHAVTVALASDREVRVARTFDAPRALVFDAFTRPEMIRRWLFGPDEWPLVECRVELRVGGGIRYVWRHVTSGKEMVLNGVFREVSPPGRLVHTELFEEDWTGGETLVTTTFDERDGRTTATIAIEYSSRDARDAALATGMADGFDQSYARLDAMIAAER